MSAWEIIDNTKSIVLCKVDNGDILYASELFFEKSEMICFFIGFCAIYCTEVY